MRRVIPTDRRAAFGRVRVTSLVALIAAGLAVVLAGCGGATSTVHRSAPARVASCRLAGSGLFVVPDRRAGCTPGVWIADRDVSRAHVCGHGYNPRPGTGVSGPLKHESERLYGESSSVDRRVEADHLYPRWLGGATVLGNFWPEPNYSKPVGFDHNPKDVLEGALFVAVCHARSLTPAQARRIFEGDWRPAFERYVKAGTASVPAN